MYEIGQKGTYHYPGGESRAKVDWDRGAYCYDLVAEDVPFSETQMVPLHPGPDGRWFEPDDVPAAALETPVETLPLGLRPREKAPLWPWIAALAMSGAALGWHVVNLLIGGK